MYPETDGSVHQVTPEGVTRPPGLGATGGDIGLRRLANRVDT